MAVIHGLFILVCLIISQAKKEQVLIWESKILGNNLFVQIEVFGKIAERNYTV